MLLEVTCTRVLYDVVWIEEGKRQSITPVNKADTYAENLLRNASVACKVVWSRSKMSTRSRYESITGCMWQLMWTVAYPQFGGWSSTFSKAELVLLTSAKHTKPNLPGFMSIPSKCIARGSDTYRLGVRSLYNTAHPLPQIPARPSTCSNLRLHQKQ